VRRQYSRGVSDRIDAATQQIGIVLADDHPLIRGGLRRVLELEGDLAVVGEAGDVEGALALVRARQPRIVVLDLNMPGEPTLPAIPRFAEAAPGAAVLVLTMEAEPGFARRALATGARGYVLKERAESELVEAVRALLAGRTYLDPILGARMAGATPTPDQAPGRPHDHAPGTPHDKAPRPAGLGREDPELAVGSAFAGHRLDALVGRGGMGVVFRATDHRLDRPVALKVIAPETADNPVFRTRFEREYRLAATLEHPNVVQIYHAGEDNGLLFLTMRYVDGTDLRKLLDHERRLEVARAASIATQVALALEHAHQHGLVHRDVKPGNVLISGDARRQHAFLTDFGITRRAGQEPLTRTGVTLGSVDYIAPEQAHGGEVDARADLLAGLRPVRDADRASGVRARWRSREAVGTRARSTTSPAPEQHAANAAAGARSRAGQGCGPPPTVRGGTRR
jgi:DNA-binding NarL/FixJ family response regulator/predicted Ser/Thr protein kinase